MFLIFCDILLPPRTTEKTFITCSLSCELGSPHASVGEKEGRGIVMLNLPPVSSASTSVLSVGISGLSSCSSTISNKRSKPNSFLLKCLCILSLIPMPINSSYQTISSAIPNSTASSAVKYTFILFAKIFLILLFVIFVSSVKQAINLS